MLLGAFRSFVNVASSLEHSYASLTGEVEKLRHDLEQRNRELTLSLGRKSQHPHASGSDPAELAVRSAGGFK